MERSLRFWVILINRGHHHVWFLFCYVLRMIITACSLREIFRTLLNKNIVYREDKCMLSRCILRLIELFDSHAIEYGKFVIMHELSAT